MRVMGYMSKKWWKDFYEGPGLLNLANKFGKVAAKTKVEREYLKVLC